MSLMALKTEKNRFNDVLVLTKSSPSQTNTHFDLLNQKLLVKGQTMSKICYIIADRYGCITYNYVIGRGTFIRRCVIIFVLDMLIPRPTYSQASCSSASVLWRSRHIRRQLHSCLSDNLRCFVHVPLMLTPFALNSPFLMLQNIGE